MKSYISKKLAAATRNMEMPLLLRLAGRVRIVFLRRLLAPACGRQTGECAGPRAGAPPTTKLWRLPQELQAELNLARGGQGAGDQACRGHRAAVGAEQTG